MTDLDLDRVVAATRSVLDGQKNALEELTQRKTRMLVEQDLKLEPGTLDATEYKAAIRQVIVEFLQAQQEAQLSQSTPANPTQAEKPPSPKEEQPKPAPEQRKRKSEAADDAPTTSKATKKRKRLSAKTVVSDDDDVADEEEQPKPAKKAKPVSAEKPGPTEKAFGQFMGLINTEMQRDLARDEEAEAAVGDRAHIVTEFDSDVSSVIDQSPVKKKGRKRKSKDQDSDAKAPKKAKSGNSDGKESKPAKTTRGKKPAVELDKNEEEIKRLKSFIVACGVRKQWAREFKGMDKPSQQIAHLRKILADLGMTGRLSLDKAKSIRAQRELQQEIQDVVEFDRKRGSGAKPEEPSEPSEDEEDEEEHVKPAKKLQHSIAAFLADQSDDE